MKSIEKEYEKQRSKSSGGSTTVGGSYAGIGLSGSQAEQDAVSKLSKGSKLSTAEFALLEEENSQIISSEMMDSYKACLAICDKGGIEFDVDRPSPPLFDEFSIGIKYNRSDLKKAPKIQEIKVTPSEAFTISGALQDTVSGSGMLPDYTWIWAKFVRSISNKKRLQEGTNDYVVADKATIDVFTSDGKITIKVPAIYAPDTTLSYGVGDIIASMLSPGEFYNNHKGQRWMLCDGDVCPLNTEYRKYIDNNLPGQNGRVPNLQGVFLRGKNNKRNTVLGNPDGDLELGAYQADSFKKHNHGGGDHSHVQLYKPKALKASETPNDGEGLFHAGTKEGRTTKQSGEIIDAEGSGETRPRNVTINYFIRID
ncbi:MAG: hypothetical protein H6603_11060 [Flavobacteriales bacterium]|nr:hypothetical protein [Flavobacteriales bacterium]MCB9205507.1 hypothetical protein [Flavobacteriales bacterium]